MTHARNRSLPPWWRTRAAALAGTTIALLLLSILLVGASVRDHHQLFVLDEATYADYVLKAADGQLWMPRGDEYGQAALRAAECRGVGPGIEETTGPVGDCSVRMRTGQDLNGGISTAAIHPPTYFVVTALGARAIRATGVTEDVVTAGRLFGAAWMAVGLLALVLLAKELSASVPATVLLVLLVATSERLLEEWQYLTPDASNVLVGSTVTLITVRWLRGRAPTWSLAAVAAASIWFKSPNLLVVGSAAIAVLSSHRLRPWRDRLIGAGALGLGAVASSGIIGVITAVRAERGFDSPQDRAQHVASLTVDHLLRNLDAFLSPLVRDGAEQELGHLLIILVLGLLVAAAFVVPGDDVRQPVATGHLLATIVGPALLVLLVFVAQHQYADIQERYGYSLVPGITAVAASFWTTPLRLAAAAALVVPTSIVALVGILG